MGLDERVPVRTGPSLAGHRDRATDQPCATNTTRRSPTASTNAPLPGPGRLDEELSVPDPSLSRSPAVEHRRKAQDRSASIPQGEARIALPTERPVGLSQGVFPEELYGSDLLGCVERHEPDRIHRFDRVSDRELETLHRVDAEARRTAVPADRGVKELLEPHRLGEETDVQGLGRPAPARPPPRSKGAAARRTGRPRTPRKDHSALPAR